MKLKALIIGTALTTLALSSCSKEESHDGEVKDVVKTEETTPEEKVETITYKIDEAASTVTWKGVKVFSDDSHNGTVDIKSGSASVLNGEIVGGEIVIDMTTLKASDLTAETGANKLIGHLSADDFFGTSTYPTAKYVITSVTDSSLIGDLTIRDKTLSYATPVTTAVEGETVSIKGTLVFDRSKFGVNFGSSVALGAFEKLEGKAKDKAIKNEIEIGLDLVAKK